MIWPFLPHSKQNTPVATFFLRLLQSRLPCPIPPQLKHRIRESLECEGKLRFPTSGFSISFGSLVKNPTVALSFCKLISICSEVSKTNLRVDGSLNFRIFFSYHGPKCFSGLLLCLWHLLISWVLQMPLSMTHHFHVQNSSASSKCKPHVIPTLTFVIAYQVIEEFFSRV